MHLLISFSSLYRPQHLSIFHSAPLSSFPPRNHFSLRSSISMDSTSSPASEVAYDYSPFLRIYKDGHVERLKGTEKAPPGQDPETKVTSKDVVYSPELNLSCRLYLPENANPNKRLPLLVYYHGGGFCIETPYSPQYHNYVKTLVAEANVVAVSVDYRLAPEHPLPVGYEDSWLALKWVASHFGGDGPEEWLNSYVDFSKVFLAGDSAGANIAHQMGIKNGEEKLTGVNLVGIVLIHPYFWGKEPIGNEVNVLERRKLVDNIWLFACPKTSGSDDPFINPVVDPKLARLGCEKVLVVVAENDVLRDRGWHYYEKLGQNGWEGKVEIMETKEEDHVFHLEKCTCENAVAMLERVVSFINENNA